MKYIYGFLFLVLLGAASVNCNPVAALAQANLQKSLSDYLVQPSVFANTDPALSAACFNKYLPILSEIANTYSVQYQACVTTAEQRTLNLTNQAAASKTTFSQETQAICTAFQVCDNDTDILDSFNCYASASKADVSQMYDISSNAAIAANTLNQGLEEIQNEESQCTNATQRTYVSDTASTYDLLDYCLQYGLTTDDTTVGTTVETTDDTTEEPSTTVAASSIVAVSSTAPTVAAAVNDFVVKTDCSDSTGTHTQTSSDGKQSQTQTGSGCQSQTSGSGSQSQSQSGSGTQSQSQCSGADCHEFKPFKPLFHMPAFAPFN
ncbi:induced during hyphae development protein 1-like [Teleopsis dalmanni]|uniref:induced during hyphae development protein 1-like n=1 Tax=Teleopsis dalmanni TaxID=139649 RepID=UPI0018CF315A|nr:induced during hyphae development protein 1-like [Teleopsis dalmanni]